MHVDESEVSREISRLLDWMRDDALVYWSQHGFAGDSGAGFDFILADGCEPAIAERLLQNQAKLAYVFARAEGAGWGRSYQHILKRLFEFVSRSGVSACRSDGYVHSLDGAWQIKTNHYEVADHGYFIIASIATYSAFGSGGDIRRALNIMDWLNLRFRRDDGTFKDSSEPAATRKLSSQLVMLECFLYLFESTRKGAWLDAAKTSAEFIHQRFAGRHAPVLFGVCDDHWQADHGVVDVKSQLQAVWLFNRLLKHGVEVAGDWFVDAYNYSAKQLLANSAGFAVPPEEEVLLLARALKACLALRQRDPVTPLDLAELALSRLQSGCLRDSPRGYFAASASGQGHSRAGDLYELMQASVIAKNYLASRVS